MDELYLENPALKIGFLTVVLSRLAEVGGGRPSRNGQRQVHVLQTQSVSWCTSIRSQIDVTAHPGIKACALDVIGFLGFRRMRREFFFGFRLGR